MGWQPAQASETICLHFRTEGFRIFQRGLFGCCFWTYVFDPCPCVFALAFSDFSVVSCCSASPLRRLLLRLVYFSFCIFLTLPFSIFILGSFSHLFRLQFFIRLFLYYLLKPLRLHDDVVHPNVSLNVGLGCRQLCLQKCFRRRETSETLIALQSEGSFKHASNRTLDTEEELPNCPTGLCCTASLQMPCLWPVPQKRLAAQANHSAADVFLFICMLGQ